jgi:hypothetical protein
LFKRFVGGLAYRIIKEEFAEIEVSTLGDKVAYIQRLAQSIANPGRRSEFLESLRKKNLLHQVIERE